MRSPATPPSRVAAPARPSPVRPPSSAPPCRSSIRPRQAGDRQDEPANAPAPPASRPSPPLRCPDAGPPTPKAQTRCSAPEVVQSSADRTRSSPPLGRPCGLSPKARSSENAATTSHPHTLRNAPPTPQRSDDRQREPCPPPANHGRSIYQHLTATGIQPAPSQSGANRIRRWRAPVVGHARWRETVESRLSLWRRSKDIRDRRLSRRQFERRSGRSRSC